MVVSDLYDSYYWLMASADCCSRYGETENEQFYLREAMSVKQKINEIKQENNND